MEYIARLCRTLPRLSGMSNATEKNEQAVREAAAALIDAYETGNPIPPLRNSFEGMDIADAYRVQKAQIPALTEKWGEIVGRKVGLTSLAMQKQLGVDSPDFGFFTEAQLYRDDARIAADTFISPKVEPEFAFLLNKELSGGNTTRADVAEAIESVHAAIEIIDSRIKDWDITLPDTIADNASCGAVAISEAPLDVAIEDLNATTCSLLIDGNVTGTGKGEDVLGDPLEAVAWLANILHEQGDVLAAGQWVLPGSITSAAPVDAGSSATADFGSLGTLTIHF